MLIYYDYDYDDDGDDDDDDDDCDKKNLMWWHSERSCFKISSNSSYHRYHFQAWYLIKLYIKHLMDKLSPVVTSRVVGNKRFLPFLP